MKAGSFYRLLPEDDYAWSLFPTFRSRVRSFIQANLPSTDPDSVIYDITQKWVSLPKTTGYWLAFADSQVVGHMASWILENYGRPFVFIYQAEMDKGYDGVLIQNDIMKEVDKWVAELNAIIPPDRPKITKGEMSTWRNPAAFARYLDSTGHSAAKVRSVIEFQLSSPVPSLLV